MYCLEVIKSDSYQTRAASVHAAVNRDSSFCDSSSGTVIHSGVHRSTAFLPKDEIGDLSFRFWRVYGQAAVNAWIVQTIGGASLENCERAACEAVWPTFKFVDATNGGACNNRVITAYEKQAGGVFRISGSSWRDIHSRLWILKQRGAIQ